MARRPLAAALALLALLLALPAAAELPYPPPPPPPRQGDAPELTPSTTGRLSLGFATLGSGTGADRIGQRGVALEYRIRHRASPTFGVDMTLTWGLTDWDRAREWIDAGNRAGEWTTDRIKAVGDWATEDKDTSGPRMLGAIFADMFLGMTYAAVPACYVGSIGGATSHLQADVTGNFHAGDGPFDGWFEGGVGALALPTVIHDWDFAFGPVAGLGADLGPVRFGVRFLWSPPALHSGSRLHGTVISSAATISFANR